jgi:hypothetical protein
MNFIMEITALQGRLKLGNREILTALTY